MAITITEAQRVVIDTMRKFIIIIPAIIPTLILALDKMSMPMAMIIITAVTMAAAFITMNTICMATIITATTILEIAVALIVMPVIAG
jgi:hypothetical protein